ncbi:MAG: hypothetical protein LBM38_05530 [Clostridiales bacterium]|jgi:hypothetical protein|nr:hypothetical protein [Clostridiales bacterium]
MYLDGLKTDEEKVNKICELLDSDYAKGKAAFDELAYPLGYNNFDGVSRALRSGFYYNLAQITDDEKIWALVFKHYNVDNTRELTETILNKIHSVDKLQDCADFYGYDESPNDWFLNAYYVNKKLFQVKTGKRPYSYAKDYAFLDSFVDKFLENKSINEINDSIFVMLKEGFDFEDIARRIKNPETLEKLFKYASKHDFNERARSAVNSMTDVNSLRAHASNPVDMHVGKFWCIEKLLRHDLYNKPLDARMADEKTIFANSMIYLNKAKTSAILLLNDDRSPSSIKNKLSQNIALLEKGKPIKRIEKLSPKKLQEVAAAANKLTDVDDRNFNNGCNLFKDTIQVINNYAESRAKPESVRGKIGADEGDSAKGSVKIDRKLESFKTACKQAGVDDAQLAKIVENYNKLVSVHR